MGRIIFIWFFAVTTSMVPSALIAQNEDLIFQRFSIQQGLSHNSVLSIIQDSRGFLWFGTYDGLNRFDGYEFKEYNFDYLDTTSIAQNLLIALHEDQNGLIWTGTAGSGLCSLDPQTDKFTRYPSLMYEKNGIVYKVTTMSAIQEDSEGVLWIGTVDGLFKLEPESKSPVHFPIGSNLSLTINSISLDSSGDIWVGTFGEGLIKIPSHDKSTYEQWKHAPENPESIIGNNVMSVFEDHRGTFWIGCMGGLDSLDRAEEKFIHFSHDPEDPNSLSTDILNSRTITEDKLGNLWIGTTNGLNKLNRKRTHFTHYYHDPYNPHSIGSNDIHSVLIDELGNLWIGTVNGGVSLTNLQPREFYLIQNQPENPNSLSSNMVRVIYEDKDEMLWIGTEGGGLNKYDRKKGIFTHFWHEPNNPKSLLNDLVSAVLEDSKGNFWIGYGGGNFYVNNGGVTKIDSSSNSFVHFDIHSSEFSQKGAKNVVGIFEDRSGIIWLNTLNGIKRFSAETQSWEHFTHKKSTPQAISDAWCYAIFEDSRDDLWIGTGSRALNKMDKKRVGKFLHFSAHQNDPNSLSSPSVRHIAEDHQGYLWFATSGGGLCQYDPTTESFTPFTKKDGLPSNSINRIEIDEDGQFWMSTNKGICRFDPVSKKVQSFDLGYGSLKHHFTSGYVNAGSSTKGKDGTLYFGGSDGIVYFHPREISPAPNPAPVVLTEFRIFDKPMPEWNESMNIILPHHQNFISMEFAALSFVNAHNNKYAYFLENFDQDWIYSDDRRFVSYTNLSPGEYTFRVKAANYDGVWSESGINLNLTILPPWWRTWWAYLLFMLLAVTAFYWMRRSIIYWERLNSDLKLQRIEAEKMHELDQAKSAFFANISHEFRTPLTLISGTVDSLKKNEGKTSLRSEAYELIERNASKLLHLIHQLLDLSKLEAGKLKVDAKPGELTGFLGYLTGSFLSLFESKEIYFHQELPEEEVLVYFDAPKLEVIFSNLLSNAYKFTPEGGEVGFYASVEPEKDKYLKLRVVVSDTGIGIPEGKSKHVFERFYQEEASNTRAYEGTGIGLSLVKELTGLLGGEVTVKSKLGKGSSFMVELPLKKISQKEIIQIKLGEKNNGTPHRKFQPHHDSKTYLPSKNTASDKPKVLVVEDNIDLRRFIDRHLREDYCVFEAENGDTGFNIAMDIIPDLIISDVMMPGMDGICLCEKLKNEDKTNHIPIILLTARADMESRLDGLEMGADDYLTKPFKIEELLVRVKNLLESREKLREKYGNSVTLNPREISVTSVEERFVQKVLDTMEKHHANPEFDVETLGRELGMSRTHLYRKLKAIINQHPTEFIQTFRLKKALMHFNNHSGNISEVAYSLGFNSLTYFTRLFKNQYGITPSEYLHQISENKFPLPSNTQNYEKRND